MKISLVMVVVGSYKNFLPSLIKSADSFFFNKEDVEVEYCLLVDSLCDNLVSKRKIKQSIIPVEEWPRPTLFRYKYINKVQREENWFEDSDYIFYIDADMEFAGSVNEEILSEITVVEHPYFINERGTPEKNPKSTAFIDNNLNFIYKQNCFFGGEKDLFINMSKFLEGQIDIDYSKGIIARWWDESHANKFYIAYATKTLSYHYNTPARLSRPDTKIKHFFQSPNKIKK